MNFKAIIGICFFIMLSCISLKDKSDRRHDIPIREIIHAVLEYRYDKVIVDPNSDRGRMLDSLKLTQIDQKIHYWSNTENFVEEFEKIGVWEDYPKLYHDTTMVVNLGSYAYTTKGGVTVYFKKISEMSDASYLAFSPPSWDTEKKRFCGFIKLTYDEIELYTVEEIDGKLICTGTGQMIRSGL